MAIATVMAAQCVCTMGAIPTPLMVLPTKRIIVEKKPLATILDNKPLVNITPFGTCRALMTPAGPGPCIPVTPAPWMPGSPRVVAGCVPVLNNSSKLVCALGGVISIINPGSMRTMVP